MPALRRDTSIPFPLAIAFALHHTIRVALALGGAGSATYLQLLEALGRKADHLAQHARIHAFRLQPTQAVSVSVIAV